MYAVTLTPAPALAVAAEHAVNGLRRALSPWAAAQMNFSESHGELESFWSGPAFNRLRAIRAAVDPDGIIRANHAIPGAV